MKTTLLTITLAGFLLSGCEDIKHLGAQTLGGSKKAKSSSVNSSTKQTPTKDAPVIHKKYATGYLLDLNEAPDEKFKHVPGVTEDIYKMIVGTRPFLDMIEVEDELQDMNVSNKDRQALYGHFFIFVDVNNDDLLDMQFIPGLTKNLSHRIESARPYKNRAELQAVIEKSRQSDDVEVLMPYFKVTKVR